VKTLFEFFTCLYALEKEVGIIIAKLVPNEIRSAKLESTPFD
jgi:hypothetical protein